MTRSIQKYQWHLTNYHACVEAKVCVDCKQPAKRNRRRCPACLAIRAENQQQVYAARGVNKKVRKRYYLRLKREGRCTKCTLPNDTKETLCSICKARILEQRVARKLAQQIST